MTEFLLLLAGLCAGAINSLAGGGSFIAFPALLAAGLPPVVANASNTYAALPGYVSGIAGFWPAMQPYRGRLLGYSIVALIFGYLGAELLLAVSDEQFRYVVPWLLLFAVVLFAFGNRIGSRLGALTTGKRGRLTMAAGLAGLAVVCLYGGFFNAGLGILLLAVLALSGYTDMLAMNGLKLWISSIVAAVAVVRFVIGGSIDWYFGTIVLVGVTIGGYTAARLARFIPQPVLRGIVIVYGGGLTAWFFWTTYLA